MSVSSLKPRNGAIAVKACKKKVCKSFTPRQSTWMTHRVVVLLKQRAVLLPSNNAYCCTHESIPYLPQGNGRPSLEGVEMLASLSGLIGQT